MAITIHVNGKDASLDTEDDTPLLWALRHLLGLTGSKFGCGLGLCGACTVLVDGVPTRTCLTPVSAVAGRRITTIEGLNGPVAEALRSAWLEVDVAQCGYCQSGQILAASALLASHPKPDDAQVDAAMGPHLCRCGSYPRIRQAIHVAADRLKTRASSRR